MGVYHNVELNATGQNCWREFELVVSSSVQNDLLLTVDQSDAIIILRLGNYPSSTDHHKNYNATSQVSISALDSSGSEDGIWQQHRIAYADLSHGAVWYISVYMDPQPGDGGAIHEPRQFRFEMSWAQDSSFKHLSTTFIVIITIGSTIVAILIIFAIKMRVQAWRRSQLNHTMANKKTNKRTSFYHQQPHSHHHEKTRFYTPAQHQSDYMGL